MPKFVKVTVAPSPSNPGSKVTYLNADQIIRIDPATSPGQAKSVVHMSPEYQIHVLENPEMIIGACG
ncbi:MAG: hypothetical protein ACXWPM_01135 [Bdellovibrionota bacterium]